jgi:catechol 2,3-dioxygenase-like lactoylglutathione lyase family enzyme
MAVRAQVNREGCHTAILVRDIRATVAFYRDVVGLPVERMAGEPENPSVVWLAGLQLVRADGRDVSGNGVFEHTGLAVRNLDEIVASLQAHGARFDQPVQDMSQRAGRPARACFVRDNEGNRFELIEYGA